MNCEGREKLAPFFLLVSHKYFVMAMKEKKGGELTNKDVEQDLKRKADGSEPNTRGYRGLQDTGDQKVRSYGTDVQKRDGFSDEEASGEENSRKKGE
jgi:hypothetical protein